MHPGHPLLQQAQLAGGAAASSVPFVELFRDGRAAVTLLLWFSYVMGIMALQFITSWLPTLIAGTGVSISLAVLTGSLFHIGGRPGMSSWDSAWIGAHQDRCDRLPDRGADHRLHGAGQRHAAAAGGGDVLLSAC